MKARSSARPNDEEKVEALEKGRNARGDLIGFANADNKTPITEFDKMLPFLDEGHEVVIGSRAMREPRIERWQPMHRRLGSKAFGGLMHACVGLNHIVDSLPKNCSCVSKSTDTCSMSRYCFSHGSRGSESHRCRCVGGMMETADCSCCLATCATFVICCQSVGSTRSKQAQRQFRLATAGDGR